MCIYVSCKSKDGVRFLLSLCKAHTFKNLGYSKEGSIQLLKFGNPSREILMFDYYMRSLCAYSRNCESFLCSIVRSLAWSLSGCGTLLSQSEPGENQKPGEPMAQGWPSSSDINSLAPSLLGKRCWVIFQMVPHRIEPQVLKAVTHLLIHHLMNFPLSRHYFSTPQMNYLHPNPCLRISF